MCIRDRAKKTEEEQYNSMKLRIKYMYEKGDTSYLDLLMESGSLSEMLNRAEYIQQISSYDRKQLARYGEIKDEIAESEKKLEAEDVYKRQISSCACGRKVRQSSPRAWRRL